MPNKQANKKFKAFVTLTIEAKTRKALNAELKKFESYAKGKAILLEANG